MIQHDVLIAGGGPTGLMLAAELALAGVDAVVIERRPNQDLFGRRAGGLHARTLEILDQRGVVDRFLAAGRKAQVAGFAWMPLDISDFPTRHNYGLALAQQPTERLLADWVGDLGAPVLRGRAAAQVHQDDAGVEVVLSDGARLRGAYLVGCDGGRSLVRKAAGIAFPGSGPTISHIIAEAKLAQTPEWGMRHDAQGLHGLNPLPDGSGVGILVTESQSGQAGDPSLEDLKSALVAVYGTDYGVHDPAWISRFNDAARQASAYRAGRVLLAGDAAHVHYPAGGQGLNLGVQDAVNLGWKLGQVVRKTAPESLLDSYERERRPVVTRVLRNTMAQVALLGRLDDRKAALREVMAELLKLDAPRAWLAGMMSGLDIRYDLGPGHPLLGRRMPDLDLATADGPVRTYELLHPARPVLLDLGLAARPDLGPWTGRLRHVEARYAGPWRLPVLGEVPSPLAVLIRPDGHVAWVDGDGRADGLAAALDAWVGPARPAVVSP
ncbi:FAD-dependent monooxygenase [Caulobacter sp. LjRoot300]|uniref:FAD-dependent monooxygenase n=1 Tax=Caulobacter sp. LjRoot300 TaxID=3342321 RepID=UPI003ECE5102